MKRIVLVAILCTLSFHSIAQEVYWVFLSDKHGTTFDPYEYFDIKALERYKLNGIDPADISNYPINERYSQEVTALADTTIGSSRWFNAIAVEATPQQIAQIERLPFVVRCKAIRRGRAQLAQRDNTLVADNPSARQKLTEQLTRMGGHHFTRVGLNGKGVRIAIFDGGFPRVNTHSAFQHLRDRKQIVATWNFCNNKADVYGWNSHGTNTLSCIAGIAEGKLIGLATGAEFLLARTEIELEPAREEVWWTQAVEWADKNGADIISSSLGYGSNQYNVEEMDGTSLVAQSANKAAGRGILVCNSAGNEGTSNTWKTIITPSDADSVLCVGGIEASMLHYRHIDFSSFGPSSDGRIKPNVCAFGCAMAATAQSNNSYDYVYGTSFACPLVAGFAACAWQQRRNLKAVEMLHEIERSADLYPYFDYAMGYGVPQASYFVNKERPTKEPTFRFEQRENAIVIIPLIRRSNATLFYHLRKANGTLAMYSSKEISDINPSNMLSINKELLSKLTLVASLDGYCDTFNATKTQMKPWGDSEIDAIENTKLHTNNIYVRDTLSNTPSRFGANAPYCFDIYYQHGTALNSASKEMTLTRYSPINRIGLRLTRNINKKYGVGFGIAWSMTRYNITRQYANALDDALGVENSKVRKKQMQQGEWEMELYQRIRLVGGGTLTQRGIFCDMGVYGAYNYYYYQVINKTSATADEMEVTYRHPRFGDATSLNWGVLARVGYDIIALYARHRLTDIFNHKEPTAPAYHLHLPRLEIGLQIGF